MEFFYIKNIFIPKFTQGGNSDCIQNYINKQNSATLLGRTPLNKLK